MGSWLKYSSPYFDLLNLSTDQQKQQVSTLIASACEFVERYCNRRFAQAEFDEVFTVSPMGEVFLNNPPISHIWRVMVGTRGVLSITNPTAHAATFAVTGDSLKLRKMDGTQTDSSISLSANNTLAKLRAAIGILAGWSATVANGCDSYPASDLVAHQFGDAKAGGSVLSWANYPSAFTFDSATGILDVGQYEPGSVPVAGLLPRGSRVRVVYVGGFVDVPEPIKQATANLVITAFSGPEGRIQSESLGGYSYTLASVDSLPASDKRVLSLYRDRRV